jgi:hypothetical protein
VRTCFVERISAKDPSAEPAACSQVQAGSGQASGAVGRSVANTAKLATADAFEQAFAWTMALSGVLLVVCLVLAPLLPRRIEFSAPTL